MENNINFYIKKKYEVTLSLLKFILRVFKIKDSKNFEYPNILKMIFKSRYIIKGNAK